MEQPASKQLTSLLSNEVLARVERMRLQPRRRLVNRSRGEHLSGKGGSSTDFADYRDYVEGDDIRYVDWNIFSRLHRPYLKLFHQEEEMNVVVLLDASASMNFEDKLLRARQLAAAFGIMGLFASEKVSVYSFNQIENQLPFLPPCSGRASMTKLLQFLEGVAPGGQAPLEEGIDAMLRRHRGRGAVILLSDFLTFADLGPSFNRLFSFGLELLAVQILGPTEIDPPLTGDQRLIDSENEEILDISSAGDLLALYQEHRLTYQQHLESQCQKRSGRFLSISSQEPLEYILLDLMRRKGWVR